jgi:signal transduction histidine kinase/ligand-binding sensor domain-containing protein
LLIFVFLLPTNAQNQIKHSNPLQTPQQTATKILFNQIPTELGLSQNVITCSFQDKTGFLWFGTKDGLNRFDGYQFKVYRQNPTDATSISDSSITFIFEDTRGRMWIGTENGLNLFDRTHEIFYRFLPDANNSNSLNHQRIRVIAEDKQGAIFITTPTGINKLELSDSENPLQDAKFSHFNHDPNNPENLATVYTGQFAVDENGAIWILLGRLYNLSPIENYAIKHFPIEGVNESRNFIKICIGRNGKIWLATAEAIFEINSLTHQTKIYEYPDNLSFGMTLINSMLEDNSGNVWFGGYWGLARLNPSTKKFDFFPSNDKESSNPVNPLLSYGINSILQDQSGAIWVGTNGKGLIRYDRQAERFAHSREQSLKISLWRGTSVRTLVEIDDDTILLGSAAGGLFRINRATNETTPFNFSNDNSLLDRIADTMLLDRAGNLWIGSGDELLKTDISSGKSVAYVLETDKVKYAYRAIVFKIFEDRNGDIWAITNTKIYRLNREADNFSGYEYDTRITSERPTDNYVDVHTDGQGIFWLATTDGLVRFDPNTKEIKRYRNNPQDVNSLSHNVVRTVAPDPFEPNILWLGTKGGGLNWFDKQAETFSALTEKDGLPNNVIYGILSDEDGNLWMSTNNGISRFNPRNRTFKNFDKKDGLQDNEFNSCAFFKSKRGELFFGGINGFNAFYPSEIKDNPNPPRVVLTDFQILNQTVSFKTPDSPLKQTITDTKEITLNYEQRFFSFEFAALDFTEPSKNQYAYQLEGFDKDLIEVGTRRTAFYTNVSPGSYVFRVIASNNDGVWNREGATVKITILPPFWQTWWFFTLMILAGIGIVFLIFYPHLSKLRYEKEIQEAFAGQLIEEQENDRKRIAAELHDGIGQSLLIIKNRAFMGEKNTEKETNSDDKIESAREQFGEISESASEALEQVREIAYYLRPSQLERLGLTSAIEEMIERVADSSGIEFDVKMDNLNGVFSKQNEINFYRIVQESLNNIIKHSKATSAKIRIKKEAGNVELIIKDNGKGFAIEAVSENKSRGFGLKGMSERARLLGGIYTVKSSAGEGTIVKVKIKM